MFPELACSYYSLSVKAHSGATLLYVTHDQIEAMMMATRVGVLDQGNLIQIG
ncbi:hypothetical protein [Granulosicoccus antarcticus]|uniref:Maltose/maltodextrin import ATP-binding protein MalK n=1 Tax=Granulosicoccus antarcticus IMCC3135 TaxID=1192854 RepID=A0A2Z2NL18_9GAMM|nr:hypothetical protein [Granulosicoccus antarcticus]ASJ70691.1 Maltose/maltodextrin import ATP-binding protein MalK [Granulosicoccus antarcticus IMCC3135]